MKVLLITLVCLCLACLACYMDSNPGSNPGHERVKNFTCDILAHTKENKIDWSIESWVIPVFFLNTDSVKVRVTKDTFYYTLYGLQDQEIEYTTTTECAKDLYTLLLVQNKIKLDNLAHKAVQDLEAEDTRK